MLRLPQMLWMPSGLRPCITMKGGVELAYGLAAPTPELQRASFVRLLQREPGFSLWCILLAFFRQQSTPRDVFEVWSWLRPQLGELLRSPLEPLDRHEDHDRNLAELETAVRAAEASWQKNVRRSPAVAHTEYFEELVARGWRWLAFRPNDKRWQFVPGWLSERWNSEMHRATDSASQSQRDVQPRAAPSTPADTGRDSAMYASIIFALAQNWDVRMSFAEALETRKISAVHEFAYGAGHELNNPFAIISARAQALMAEELSPDRSRALANIVTQSQRGHSMIADLMAYAKPPEPRFESLGLAEVVASVTLQFRQQLVHKNISVETSLASTPPIRADRTQMELLVWSVLKNAEAVVASPGWIGVCLEHLDCPLRDEPRGAGWLRLAIEDDGPGLEPRSREHLFDPFYSGREAGRGLGFGMCKVWRVVNQHFGRIRAEASPRGGCRLVIELPLELK
ncbi:MAG: HAMP domain-containing sensor histidine kinase [Planctomycetota bacterium]|nr:HAMP domain-containing sensor histidine kinase [Planctomycetota bacterium]